MADRKITDMSALAAGSQATGDLIAVVDVSEAAAADKNKKMTMENLFQGIPGNVGIGTTSPARPLSVSSSQISARFTSSSSDSQIEVVDSSGTVVYGSASGNAIIQAGGSERLRINSSGRVGIGTTAPTAELHVVKSSGESSLFLDRTGGALLYMQGTASAAVIGTGTNHPVYIRQNSGDAITIDTSKRVGIGTSSPSSFATSDADNLVIGSNSGDNGLTIVSQSGNYNGTIRFSDGTSGADQYRGTIQYYHGDDYMRFYTNGTERMRIDSSGRVGIGTTTPGSFFANADNLVVGTGSANNGITIYSGTTSEAALCFADGTASNAVYIGRILYNHNTDSLQFDTAANPRMRIDSSGHIYISPTSAGLTRASAATSHGHLVVHADESGAAAYRAIEIGNDVANGTNSGGIICGKRKDQTHTPTVVASCWDNGSSNVGYYGGGWSTGGAPMNELRFYTAASYTSAAATGNQVMTVTSGGRLGIGVTAPTHPLHVNQGATATNDVARFSQDSDSGVQQKITIGFTKDKADTHPQVRLGAEEFDSGDRRASFFVATRGSNDDTAPTERMRITDAGQHFAISSDNTLTSSTTQAAGTTYLTFRGRHSASSILGGTESFKVFSNGDVQNTNDSYGAISDVKLKENIVDAGSQWDDFKAVRFRKFNFKESTGHETFTQLGVIAQELELVSPGLISESPDLDDEGNNLGTVTKSVKYSVLTKKALVALQEAMTRIETLEAKVAALEAG